LVTKTTTWFLQNHFFVTKRYIFSSSKTGELLARVKHRIRSPNERQSDSILAHGEVVLDLLTWGFTAAGIEHDLTAREFTMLEFFLRDPGQVISREQLLSRVWGSGNDPASNVVDVYIRHLWQKLGNDLIQQVCGMAYWLG
jgi:DNA-binding response OmpR family regulator